MAYQHFLEEFAKAQGIGSVDALMSEYAERFSFQISSRDRAQKMIDLLATSMNVDFAGKRILDVGCAYGSFSIEMAKRGATVVGVDISDKWLKLAEINARDEVDAKFLNCDASAFRARDELGGDAPFDIVVINDVFEHIFDTTGLLENLRLLTQPGSLVYFKIPNGLATRSVLQEGHKKVFGISLLAPDYWSHYVTAPFHIYYRRWPYYVALFNYFEFGSIDSFNLNTDESREVTARHISNDLTRIQRGLKREHYERPEQYHFVRRALELYFEEVRADIGALDWADLFFKYRVTFWEGVLRRTAPRGAGPAPQPAA